MEADTVQRRRQREFLQIHGRNPPVPIQPQPRNLDSAMPALRLRRPARGDARTQT